MPYVIYLRHWDYDEVEKITARSKDELIGELMHVLNRSGYYANIDDSDYS